MKQAQLQKSKSVSKRAEPEQQDEHDLTELRDRLADLIASATTVLANISREL